MLHLSMTYDDDENVTPKKQWSGFVYIKKSIFMILISWLPLTLQ